MPRAMSFFLTKQQIINQTKTVTRRNGWKNLKKSDVLWAVEKCMGLKKGEKHKRLAQIEIISVYREPLNEIDYIECMLEGFPDFTPKQFISMYCTANNCPENQIVNRIEFKYLEAPQCSST